MPDFDIALQYTLINEGGFVENDPPGSCTNFGLTQDTVAHFKGKPVSEDYMRKINPAEVRTIYFFCYWLPISGEQIKNDGIGTAIFDVAVNRGITVSAKLTQQVLNTICAQKNAPLVIDGMLGPISVGVLNQSEPQAFIAEFAGRVKEGYHDIVEAHPEKAIYLDGWLNRADRLLTLV